jgi:predicted nucleic acid-binding protein
LDVEKRGRALEVLAPGGVVSAQVLNEFAHVAHKRRRRSWPEIEAAIGVIRDWSRDIAPITSATHGSAVAPARDHGFAFYRRAHRGRRSRSRLSPPHRTAAMSSA